MDDEIIRRIGYSYAHTLWDDGGDADDEGRQDNHRRRRRRPQQLLIHAKSGRVILSLPFLTTVFPPTRIEQRRR